MEFESESKSLKKLIGSQSWESALAPDLSEKKTIFVGPVGYMLVPLYLESGLFRYSREQEKRKAKRSIAAGIFFTWTTYQYSSPGQIKKSNPQFVRLNTKGKNEKEYLCLLMYNMSID